MSSLLNLASLCVDRGRPAEAVPLLAAARAAAPGRIDLVQAHGVALERAGRLDEAEAAYREVLRREPSHAHARRGLSVVAPRRRDVAQAVRLGAEAAVLAPEDSTVLFDLGNALFAPASREKTRAEDARYFGMRRPRRRRRAVLHRCHDHQALEDTDLDGAGLRQRRAPLDARLGPRPPLPHRRRLSVSSPSLPSPRRARPSGGVWSCGGLAAPEREQHSGGLARLQPGTPGSCIVTPPRWRVRPLKPAGRSALCAAGDSPAARPPKRRPSRAGAPFPATAPCAPSGQCSRRRRPKKGKREAALAARSEDPGRPAVVHVNAPDAMSRLLATIKALPPLPSGIARLLALAPNDPNHFEEALGIIRSDPALAGQVIKLANSALYGGRADVDSLERAVVRVGARMVVAVLTSAHLSRTFNPHDRLISPVWIPSASSAIFSQALAEQFPGLGLAPESAYTYGLLHDVGRLVLVQLFRNAMSEIIEEEPDPLAALQTREEELCGVSHAVAGRLLGNRWRFPPTVTLVIAAHHLPLDQRRGYPLEVARLIDVVNLADCLSHALRDVAHPGDECDARALAALESEAASQILERLGLSALSVLPLAGPGLEQLERQCQAQGLRRRHRAASPAS